MRRRIGPGLVFLFLMCAHARGLLYAQAPEDPRSLLDAYAAIAERYREGTAAAVRELQALGPLRLKTLNETGSAAISISDSSKVRAAFLKIIDDFRAGYVLTYSPEGVPKEGWHSIDVRLKGTRGDVHARRGYSKP